MENETRLNCQVDRMATGWKKTDTSLHHSPERKIGGGGGAGEKKKSETSTVLSRERQTVKIEALLISSSKRNMHGGGKTRGNYLVPVQWDVNARAEKREVVCGCGL